jgi:RHS repeat-associated protein
LARARVSKDGKVLSEQRYGYDACARLTQLEDLDEAEGYKRTVSYDAEGRLTSVSDGMLELLERYEHDAKGNIVRAGLDDVEVDALDAPLRIGSDEIAYDDLGNMERLPGPKGVIHCRYAADSSLVEAQVSGGQGGDATWRYRYDALGRRVRKTDGERTWRFGWVGHQLLWEEFQETPTARPVRRDYLWCPDSTVPVAFRERGRTYWLQCDARGAPIRAFRSDGSVAWRARYDAFGAAHEEIAQVRQPWRLAGQYHDEETGLHYSVCRYYSPFVRSYLSRDPLWYEPGAANYSYARNDPYNYSDPFGGPFFLLAAVAAVAVGAVVGAVVAGVTGGNPISGAIDGAVSVVGGIAGGIVGGMVGGPAGMVAGAMVGSSLGAAAGSLADNMLNGEPTCLSCAAKAAGVALVIDAALLGLGKIPGVRRAARALGDKLAEKGSAIKKWANRSSDKLPDTVPVTLPAPTRPQASTTVDFPSHQPAPATQGTPAAQVFRAADADAHQLHSGETFRGDTRSPAEIKAAGGFQGRNPEGQVSLDEHMKAKRNPSQWISASKSPDVASLYSVMPNADQSKFLTQHNKGYSYVIDHPGGVDVNTVPGITNTPNLEVAYDQGVPWSSVKGWTEVESAQGAVARTKFIPNPDYVPPN